MKKQAYNLIAKHKIGGVFPAGIKYFNVNDNLLLSKIQYLCENYIVEVIFIYDAESKKLAGWYRPVPPQQGLTWKHQHDKRSFTDH